MPEPGQIRSNSTRFSIFVQILDGRTSVPQLANESVPHDVLDIVFVRGHEKQVTIPCVWCRYRVDDWYRNWDPVKENAFV